MKEWTKLNLWKTIWKFEVIDHIRPKCFKVYFGQILFGPFFNTLTNLNSKTKLPCFDSLTLFKSQRIMTPFPAADAIKFSKIINHKVTKKKSDKKNVQYPKPYTK